MTDLPKPDYARNMCIVGHTDQGGRPDGVQVMVERGKTVGTAEAKRKRDWTAGLSVYDISTSGKPRRIGFMAVDGG